MKPCLSIVLLVIALLVTGCNDPISGYTALARLSRDGFARDAAAVRALEGQEVKVWGYVDHGNLYGDEGAQKILAEWWSGHGPNATTWRFNLKAGADDEVGHSIAVYVPNDAGRDDLLAVFVADARAQRPTRVFVTGKLFTFDAPASATRLTGLYLELASSNDIRLEHRAEP
jgi:hypothetical protein